MLTILLFNCCVFSIMFIFMNHPISFGFILLMQTLMISTISGMHTYNYWFSYILFLIMVGGMLILFMYMTSVASNEKFKFPKKMIIVLMLYLISIMILYKMDYYIIMLDTFYMDLFCQPLKHSDPMIMNKYLNFPNMMIMIMLMSYLLITLIAVVKITKSNYGPLRQAHH